MPAISLTFSKESKKKLYKIYRAINKKFGNQMLQIHQLLEPHVSLYLTNYTEEEEKIIKKAINKIVKKNKVISINLEGIGIFQKGNNRYNLHFNISYNLAMQKIHKELWKELEGKIVTIEKNHYNPLTFIPHISIPIRKKKNNKTVVIKIMKQILDFDLKSIELKADKISYIYGNLERPQIYLAKYL
jgi:2'-5' RNA ligase